MKHHSMMNITNFVVGMLSLFVLSSCALNPIQSSNQAVTCTDTFREPATDQPFNLNLGKLLRIWDNRFCQGVFEDANDKQEALASAIDLATQEQRAGRVAIANLIMAQARIGTFQNASEPSRFLAQLNKVISKEREQLQNTRIPDDQIENYIQISALKSEASASGADHILPKELRGPLSYLPDTVKTDLTSSLKAASGDELVTIESQVEELYARDGEGKWKDEIEESLNRCRGQANLNHKLFYEYGTIDTHFKNKSTRAPPSQLFFSGIPLSSL